MNTVSVVGGCEKRTIWITCSNKKVWLNYSNVVDMKYHTGAGRHEEWKSFVRDLESDGTV